METTVERSVAVDSDGWIYDVDTGEVLGRNEVTEAFIVDSDEKAEAVLEIRSKIQGDIAGIEARLQAVTEQLQALKTAQLRRLSWWEYRFAPSLTAYARSCLRGRSRTAQFGWGSVKFRTNPGSSQIVDMDRAVEYCRTWNPDAIKTVSTVTIKGVKAARDAAQEETGEIVSLGFLVEGEPHETASIETGIPMKGTS